MNSAATTEIYTLSLHDALPILIELAEAVAQLVKRELLVGQRSFLTMVEPDRAKIRDDAPQAARQRHKRSEEHTSELQSHVNLVCRLLLEKKKKKNTTSCNTGTH